METGKTHHLSLSVTGCLRQTPDNNKLSWVNDDNGHPLTNKQLRAELKKADFEGKKLLLMSDKCDGFSFETGCPGHIRYIVIEDYEFEEGNG